MIDLSLIGFINVEYESGKFKITAPNFTAELDGVVEIDVNRTAGEPDIITFLTDDYTGMSVQGNSLIKPSDLKDYLKKYKRLQEPEFIVEDQE